MRTGKRAVEAVFAKKLSEGAVYDYEQLSREASKLGYSWSWEDHERVMKKYPDLRKFSQIRHKRPERFQRIFWTPFRSVHVDLAFLNPKLRRFNAGMRAMLVAVCEHTNLLEAHPIRDKSTREVAGAVSEIMERMNPVKKIFSDRERAIDNETFLNWASDRGVEVVFMSTRSKSYRSEKMISYLKRKLSQLMEVHRTRKWTGYVRSVCDEYNRKLVPGTRFRRIDVTEETLTDFLEQKYGVEDYYNLVQSRKICGVKVAPPDKEGLRRKVQKFAEGETVLASAKELGESGMFDKPSVKGYFSPEKYVIHKSCLAMTKDLGALPSKARSRGARARHLSDSFFLFFSLFFFVVFRIRPRDGGRPLARWFREEELVSVDDDDTVVGQGEGGQGRQLRHD